MKRGVLLLCVWVAVSSAASETSTDTWATPVQRPPMKFEVKDAARIPLDLPFLNEKGSPVTLRRYFQVGRPVILNLVYFQCPSMCTAVLNGLVTAMRGVVPTAGKGYAVLTVSIDAREKPSLAARKRKAYVERYGRSVNAKGWAFLTGEESSIRALADSVGFPYRYYADIDQFDHPVGVVVLSPGGQVTGYLMGSTFDPNELQGLLRRSVTAP